MDLVSIVIPIYNSEKFLPRCLDSIINQKYSNIEVILVDDGSKDQTAKICKSYADKDNRIKYFYKDNSGVSSTRNFGIKMATGKYISFIDSDDYVSENYILDLIDKIKKGYSIVFGTAVDFTNESKIVDNSCNTDLIFKSKEDIVKEILLEKNINGTCWGNMYLLDIVKNISFDEKMNIAEDLRFNIDYLDRCSDDCKTIVLGKKNYYYYINENSLIHSKFNKNWLSEIDYCCTLINKYNNTNLYDYAVKRYLRINISCIKNFKLTKLEKKEFISNIKKYKRIFLKSNKFKLIDKIKFIINYYYVKIR